MASEVKTNKLSPATSTTINVGDSGDTLALATDAVTGFQVGSDAQGDVLYHDGTDYTRLGAGTSGDFLKTQGTSANPVWASAGGNTEFISAHTASSDASIEITSGFSSDYLVHVFKIVDVKPETNDVKLEFYLSDDGGSSYFTTGMYGWGWGTSNNMAATVRQPSEAGEALANNTAYGYVSWDVGNDAGQDYSPCGSLQIFKATDTENSMWYGHTFFWSEANALYDQFVLGTTASHLTAVNAIKFQFSSGDFSGTVRFYGVKKT